MIGARSEGGPLARLSVFITELRRRRVVRALLGWSLFSFAVLQVYEPVMHGLHLPEWTLSAVVVSLGLGFPVTASLGWIFDLTATGIARTPEGRGLGFRGPRLALLIAGLGTLAAAPGLGWYLLNHGGVLPLGEAGRPSIPPAIPSIAVLPFEDLSRQRDQAYFSEGISEEIRNSLARLDGLRVAGHASASSFRDKREDLPAIGEKLHVGAVLEGSVRRDGSRVRVTAQVSEVRNGTQLWSQNYDRELTDVFAVQDEIAAAVVAALRVKLLPGQAPSTRPYRTTNPEVYNQYLIGHRFFGRESRDGMRRAVAAFQKAVALEPNYAPGLAGLALALVLVLDGSFDWTEDGWADRGQRAIAAADLAVRLAPDLAEALATRGKVRSWVAWDWTGASADLERAVRLDPGDALVQQQYAALLASLGRLPEAISAGRRAIELDPLRGNAWQLLGYWYNLNGQFGLAGAALDRALELNPDSEVTWMRQSQALLWNGKPEGALALLEGTHRSCMTCEAMAQHDLGHPAESQRALDALLARAGGTAPYLIACVYAWRGEHDLAFEWLERAAAKHHPDLVFAKVDLDLQKLRADPRWALFLRKMNLPVD
jgi:serine/threonine-protein kinase